AFKNARVDDVMGRIREAVVGTRLHWGRGVRGVQREGHFIAPKKEREATRGGAGDIVGSRSVVGVVGVVDQWLPIRVADGCRVAVVVAFLNGSEGSPENEVELSVPSGDPRIAHRQVDQREEARTVIDAELMSGSDVARSLVPQHLVIEEEE